MLPRYVGEVWWLPIKTQKSQGQTSTQTHAFVRTHTHARWLGKDASDGRAQRSAFTLRVAKMEIKAMKTTQKLHVFLRARCGECDYRRASSKNGKISGGGGSPESVFMRLMKEQIRQAERKKKPIN